MHLNSLSQCTTGITLQLREQELGVHKGSVSDSAFKECSKWQESLGGQFVFSWGAVFVAFSLPRGKQGQSAAACRGLWELLTSDPCCGSHGRFPEEGHHCQRTQPYTTACDAIHAWIGPVHHRYKSEIWHIYRHESCILIVTHEDRENILKNKKAGFWWRTESDWHTINNSILLITPGDSLQSTTKSPICVIQMFNASVTEAMRSDSVGNPYTYNDGPQELSVWLKTEGRVCAWWHWGGWWGRCLLWAAMHTGLARGISTHCASRAIKHSLCWSSLVQTGCKIHTHTQATLKDRTDGKT